MRSMGLVLLTIGIFLLYLGVTGKAGRAWSALRTGVYTPPKEKIAPSDPEDKTKVVVGADYGHPGQVWNPKLGANGEWEDIGA